MERRFFLRIALGVAAAALAVTLWWSTHRRVENPAGIARVPMPWYSSFAAQKPLGPGAGTAPTPEPRPPEMGAPPEPTGPTISDIPRARSLRDTDVDGDLELDENGRFVATRTAIRMFDYYLSAAGEESEAEIRTHVLAFAKAGLAEEDVNRVVRLFDGYLDYRASLASRFTQNVRADDPRGALRTLRDVQREAFGADDAERMFGLDNLLIEVQIERAAVAAEPKLDPQERAARVASIEARLPEPIRTARARRVAILP